MNIGAPEGRNSIVILSKCVAAPRLARQSLLVTHGLRRGLQIFRRYAANLTETHRFPWLAMGYRSFAAQRLAAFPINTRLRAYFFSFTSNA